MTLADLMRKVDGFVTKHSVSQSTEADRRKMKDDLLDLVQEAIDHGAEKDQNKITGIIVKGIKSFMGGGKD